MSLKIDVSEKIGRVMLDSPPVNAVTLDLYERIGVEFEALSSRDDVNVIVFTGAGKKAFCAGLDLNEFLAATIEDDPKRAAIIRRSFARIRHAAVPVIGSINGPALGAGAVFASVCDIRLAADHATFGMPEVNVGRCGGGAHMGRHFPPNIIRQMFFTGEPISAQEAYRFGFVSQVLPFDELANATEKLARKIAAKAPLGLRMGKQSLNEIEFLPVEQGYEIEQGFSTRLMATEDAREATRAVVEKRPPVFKGQ